MIEAKGHSGTVRFDGRFVTIARTGFLARATVGKGEKRIPVPSITAVQWKPAGPLVNGAIQFTIGGGNERRSRFGRQTFGAVGDENSVVFTRKQGPTFERPRAEVERAIAAAHAPQQYTVGSGGLAEQLAQLGVMRNQGMLSESEFAAAKARLLG